MHELTRRAVVFNLSDPYQRKLHDHTQEYTNFSSYIKRLIQRDMEGGKIEEPVKKDMDTSLMDGLI